MKAGEGLTDILKTPSSGLMRENLDERAAKYSTVGASRNRMEGIVTRDGSSISSGRTEGVNGSIKGLRQYSRKSRTNQA